MPKYKLTQSQFNEISLLLKRRVRETRAEQKNIRAKIRKSGFMISDYFNGFSDFDYDRRKRIIRNTNKDIEVFKLKLKKFLRPQA